MDGFEWKILFKMDEIGGYPYFREPPYGYGNIMSMMSMFVIVFSRMY